MKDEIISYREMCDNENVQTLQRGMTCSPKTDPVVKLV